RETFESKDFKKRKSNLHLALGKDVSGRCWADDLSKMPHLLVAGATGAGKSVCLNSIILSLLYQNNPDTLRLILVDPKRVEFPIYNGIPHLMTPVITDVTKTVYALRWAIAEMDNRFDILSKQNKRDIASYNAVNKTKLPYLVIIIDELADLMVAAAAEVETSIIRLTQMARAVGIHLIVATQRPSVDVITGLIKANIPARIAFSVASLMDSRTILDSAGAEKLVGKGDMLFMTPATSTPRRLQGNFVSDEEIKRVVEFLKNATDEEPSYNDEVVSKPSGPTSFDYKGGSSGGGGNDDELFDDAKECVIKAGKASASFLQRRLRIGYARAARLIDLLEDAGIVGPAAGAKPRDILSTGEPAVAETLKPEIPSNSNYEDPEPLDDYDEEIEDEDDEDEYEEDSDIQEEELDDEEIDEEDEDFLEDDDEEEEEEPKKKSNKNKGDEEDEIY
ncbi:DNA translocase FtsK, partial [Candidatus Falkowbacteria bacterium]|nr:DNA translocase FtsK [Candidatus Falkowbacteria bacterium]